MSWALMASSPAGWPEALLRTVVDERVRVLIPADSLMETIPWISWLLQTIYLRFRALGNSATFSASTTDRFRLELYRFSIGLF